MALDGTALQGVTLRVKRPKVSHFLHNSLLIFNRSIFLQDYVPASLIGSDLASTTLSLSSAVTGLAALSGSSALPSSLPAIIPVIETPKGDKHKQTVSRCSDRF